MAQFNIGAIECTLKEIYGATERSVMNSKVFTLVECLRRWIPFVSPTAEIVGAAVIVINGRMIRNCDDHDAFAAQLQGLLPTGAQLVDSDGQVLRMRVTAAGYGSDSYVMVVASPQFPPIKEGQNVEYILRVQLKDGLLMLVKEEEPKASRSDFANTIPGLDIPIATSAQTFFGYPVASIEKILKVLKYRCGESDPVASLERILRERDFYLAKLDLVSNVPSNGFGISEQWPLVIPSDGSTYQIEIGEDRAITTERIEGNKRRITIAPRK